LSRRPDHHTGDNDNDNILVLPPSLFVDTITSSSLDDCVCAHQLRCPELLAKWTLTHNLSVTEGLHWRGAQLVVVDDNTLRRGVISLYHDSITARHPRITKTLWAIGLDYWWQNMKNSITNYIKGCTMCQSCKNHPNNPKPPPFPITTNPQANPFEVIALDFITKLPTSSGYDTILTITDHDCSKAAIFIPCNEAIDAEHTALLYATYVLPHYGLPKRIISDRDTCFTATFIRELCRLLQIEQNISMAYHPQTDGQSENTNKWVEQFLCIYINFQQTNWASLLPIIQYAHNSWPSATTKKAPFELLMGHVPRVHQVTRTSTVPSVEERLQTITEARQQAQDTIKHAQNLVTNLPTQFIPYCAGDRVWLEARNLTTTHPSAKLAPKRYGPFLVTAAISRTSFRLKLPPQWKIHNVFHASLLTPYKETPEHGPNFPEPSPDLIDGEPEWEVEQVLNARRQCNQLQYMVRWKGFSEAHDSWEPANNIHAEQLIEDFYRQNPSTIRSSTHINQPALPTSLTICCITMSSPTYNSTPLAARISSPSPTNSVPLADRLSSPPLVLMDLPHRVPTPESFPSPGLTNMEVNTPDPDQESHFGIPVAPPTELAAVATQSLASRIGATVASPTPTHHMFGVDTSRGPSPPLLRSPSPLTPLSTTTTSSSDSDSPNALPPGFHVPNGYTRYNPFNENHKKYHTDILTPDGTQKRPHFIQFHFDCTGGHRHLVLCRCQDNADYGIELEAVPHMGPSTDPVRDADLAIFNRAHPEAMAVELGLHTLKDLGVKADVDRFRYLEEEHAVLLERERALADAWRNWRVRSGNIRTRLTASQAHSRVHPYLRGVAYIADPRDRLEELASGGTPIHDVIGGFASEGSRPQIYFPKPYLHDEACNDIMRWATSTAPIANMSSDAPRQPVATPIPYPICYVPASRDLGKCNRER
jgi:hypothetical protein